MIAADGLPWGSRPASSASDFTGNPYQQRGDFGRGLSLGRCVPCVRFFVRKPGRMSRFCARASVDRISLVL
jgi:hypothetical protein